MPLNLTNPENLTSLFTGLLTKPVGIRFHDQHHQEKILLLVRRHWLTNLPWLVFSLILLWLPVFDIPLGPVSQFLNITLPFGLSLILLLFWYLAVFGFMLFNFLFWFYNVGLITTERIIDIDFIYLLYSEITSTLIGKVEDVTSKRIGFLSVFFDIGNVFVQTAGTEPNIEFDKIPQPNLVVRLISSLMRERRHT